nr:MAG TPA: hypothetical protein [Caudoviricetes sp.]
MSPGQSKTDSPGLFFAKMQNVNPGKNYMLK